MMFGQQFNGHRIFERLAKTWTRLRVCAGWSGPLLVAHTTLFEVSCRGSNIFCPVKVDCFFMSATYIIRHSRILYNTNPDQTAPKGAV